jgi:hypothetical protein
MLLQVARIIELVKVVLSQICLGLLVAQEVVNDQ